MLRRRNKKADGITATLSAVNNGAVTPGPSIKLGALLLQDKLITDRQLKEALLQQKASGKRLGTLLVDAGLIDEKRLAQAIAHQYGLEVVDLRKTVPQTEALKSLPEATARALNAIPISTNGDEITIAVTDPVDRDAWEQLVQATGSVLRLKLVIAPATDIKQTINLAYRVIGGVAKQVEAFQAIDAERRGTTPLELAVSEDAPVVKVMNLIITQGLSDRASDIHIEPQDDKLRIRYRVDGALHDVLALPSNMATALVSRIKIMGSMNIVERQRPQDGQIEMNIEGRPLDIRVSTTPTIWGEKAVLRLLDKSKPLFRLEDLGMPPDIQAPFTQLVGSPFGMMICAGPTGSGKTTTLYATISEINDTERNIMTIEDPVEYVFPTINQIQIREQAGITFAGGLKSILRQDPDIILVGEMRDVETARIAVQSALTGHLVLSSIHATDSVSALHRFLDMGIEPFLIAAAVTGIMGQRLVRRTCTHCKVNYKPNAEEMSFFTESGGSPTAKLYRGEGCNFCSQTGYQERIGVYELLQMTEDMKQLVVRHASHDKLMSQAMKQGLRPLRAEAIRLVEAGVTTIPEVVRSIYML